MLCPRYSAAFSEMYKILPDWVIINRNPSSALTVQCSAVQCRAVQYSAV